MPFKKNALSFLFFFGVLLLYAAGVYWLHPATKVCGPYGLPFGPGGVIAGACRAIFIIILIAGTLVGLLAVKVPTLTKKRARLSVYTGLLVLFAIGGYFGAQSFVTYIGKVQEIPSTTDSKQISKKNRFPLGIETFQYTDPKAVPRTDNTFALGDNIYFNFNIVGLTTRTAVDDMTKEFGVNIGLVVKLDDLTVINEPNFYSSSGTVSIDDPSEVFIDLSIVGHIFPKPGQYQLMWTITDTVSQELVTHKTPLVLR